LNNILTVTLSKNINDYCFADLFIVIVWPLSCHGHVMSLRRRRFVTVGCADGLVPTNALCLVRCVTD